MRNQAKIFKIIAQRGVISLNQLQQVSCLKRIAILRAIIPLLESKRVKAVSQDNVHYFSYNIKSIDNG